MQVLLYCLIFHFIADFLFQSRNIAQNKSTKLSALCTHLFIIVETFLIGGIILIILRVIDINTIGVFGWPIFSILNAVIHGVIDWNIWRLYKKTVVWRKLAKVNVEFKYWEDKYFYTTIGLDQLLHVITFMVLIWWLL